MNVRDAMTKDVQTVERTGTLADAVHIMRDADCGVVPVVESGKHLCGIVTDRDCALQAFEQGKPLGEITVADAMSTSLVTCKPGDSLEAAEQKMADAQVRRIPVVDDSGDLQGILATADVARMATKNDRQRAQVGATIAAISQPN